MAWPFKVLSMKNKLLTAIVTPLLALGALAFSFTSIKAPEKEEAAYAWSGNQTCSVDASYYSSCENLYGDELAEAIRKCNKATNLYYKDWTRYERADEAENDSSSIISIYTRHTIGKKNHVSSSYDWNLWNREHIFTQTAFPDSSEDTHNIFACEGEINYERGNKKFGDLSSVTTTVKIGEHVTDCKSTSTYFEPCDEAKGEVARACLYVATTYPDYKLTGIFQSVALCLKWHAEHPVTNREIYRNNKVHSIQGNRNPFVDHPSYANKLYSGYTQYTAPDPIDGSTSSGGPKVTGVSFDETEKYVAVGSSITLTPIFAPADATNKGYEILNGNYSIISITKNGQSFSVTGLAEGVANVTVKTNDGNFEATCKITVNKDGLPPAKEEPTGGCFGSIVTGSLLVTIPSLLGFAFLAIRKRKQD